MLIKITRGNQVTIPKEIIHKAHLKQGRDYLNAEYRNGVIFLKPVDVEERVPDEIYEKLLQKAAVMGKGDVKVSAHEARRFLKDRMKS